ncbi:MAG: AEC family transporter [Hasllibacter sp.]
MGDLIAVIGPVFLLIGFGYAARATGAMGDAGIDGLMKFTQKFAIPALLFRAISTLDLGAEFDWRLLLAFYAGALISFAAAAVGARRLFGRSREDSVAIGFIALFSNSVLLGLPITERAFGAGALAGNYAIIAIHSPFCYGVGITAMEVVRARAAGNGAAGLAPKVLRAMFSNALILGIALGFAVNLGGVPLPAMLTEALDMLVRAALPAALFGLGGVLWRYRPEGDLATVAFVCGLSLVLHPAIAYGLGSALGLGTGAIRSAVLTAAMAPGINTYIFADMYGRARRVAATAVLFGTGASLVTALGWLAALP